MRICTLGLALLIGLAIHSTNAAGQPNVIVILADDLGYNDLGFFDNPNSPSPHLDQLAASGLTFTDFYAGGPVCSPTRASLLTGKFPSRVGLEGVYRVKANRDEGMALDEVTIAEILKDAGYATGLIGKWHLGYEPKFNPVQQGFDYFKGFLSGNIDYQSHVDGGGYADWWTGIELTPENGYATDLINQETLGFVEAHQDKPFFLLVAHGAPHFPFQGRNDPAFRTAGEETGGSSMGIEPESEWPRIYQEMISVMDEGVGMLTETLEELGLAENTLVIFFSDNGGLKQVSDHGPLRGWKTSLWEGGIRVPAMMYWKGKISPAVCSDPVSSVDLYPTIARLAGVDPSRLPEQDGVDITPVLSGKSPQDRTLLWRFTDQAAARSGPWKLMRDGEETHLFHLPSDPGETNDLSGLYPYVKYDLLQTMAAWEKELPPPLTN